VLPGGTLLEGGLVTAGSGSGPALALLEHSLGLEGCAGAGVGVNTRDMARAVQKAIDAALRLGADPRSGGRTKLFAFQPISANSDSGGR